MGSISRVNFRSIARLPMGGKLGSRLHLFLVRVDIPGQLLQESIPGRELASERL